MRAENAERTKPLDLGAIRARAEWLVNQWTAPAFGRKKFHDDAVEIARDDVPALLAELERLREALGDARQGIVAVARAGFDSTRGEQALEALARIDAALATQETEGGDAL